MRLHKLRSFFKIFYLAISDMIKHDGIEHAGYLSFLSILSFFPFLVFFTATLGVFGESSLGREFIDMVILQNQLLPNELRLTLEPRISEITSGPPQGLLTVAIVGAIWTASSAVEGFRTILNRAYRVHVPPAYIFRRLMSILQFLLLTGAIIVAMSVFILVPLLWTSISAHFPLQEWGLADLNLLRYLVTIALLFLSVVAMYHLIPNIKLHFRDVAPGAALVVLGWMGAAGLLSIYLKHFDQVSIIYGSLGGIIATLLFFYVMSIIVIFGAEFNYRISRERGERFEIKQ